MTDRQAATTGATDLNVDRPAEWLRALDADGDPWLEELGSDGLKVWHVRLKPMRAWPGPWSPDIAYGKGSATVVDEKGQSASAEVTVARRLRSTGWQSRVLLVTWLPPTHWRPFVAMANDREALPAQVDEMLAALGRKGAPDVLAWAGTDSDMRIAGVECKRLGRDRVKADQATWYRRAIEQRWIAQRDLVVAEWTTVT